MYRTLITCIITTEFTMKSIWNNDTVRYWQMIYNNIYIYTKSGIDLDDDIELLFGDNVEEQQIKYESTLNW